MPESLPDGDRVKREIEQMAKMASAKGASRGGMPSRSDMNIEQVMIMAQASAIARGTEPNLMKNPWL